jgi:hypothetical protein
MRLSPLNNANQQAAQSFRFQRAMVITMISVRMMQMAVNQIIHVIAMRNSRMAALWSMNMPAGVFLGGKRRGAVRRIAFADLDDVFVYLPLVWVVQMAVMQIIHMIAMFDRRMSAVRPVNVSVVSVCCAGI